MCILEMLRVHIRATCLAKPGCVQEGQLCRGHLLAPTMEGWDFDFHVILA